MAGELYRVKAISSIYSYFLSFALGQGGSKPCYFLAFSFDSLAPPPPLPKGKKE